MKVSTLRDYEICLEGNPNKELLSTPQKHEIFDVCSRIPDSSHATDTREETPIRYLSPMRLSSAKSSKKSFKGLKTLSVKVKNIVHKNVITTYKKVADELIQELSVNGRIGMSKSSKERVKC